MRIVSFVDEITGMTKDAIKSGVSKLGVNPCLDTVLIFFNCFIILIVDKGIGRADLHVNLLKIFLKDIAKVF